MVTLPQIEQDRFAKERWSVLGLYFVGLATSVGLWLVNGGLSLNLTLLVTAMAVGSACEILSIWLLSRASGAVFVARYLSLGLSISAALSLFHSGLIALIVLPASIVFLISLTIGAGVGVGAAILLTIWTILLTDNYSYTTWALASFSLFWTVPLAIILERRFGQETKEEVNFSDLIGFETVSEGVIVVDPSGHVFYLNPAASTLLGWKRDEAKNLPISSVLPLFDDKDSPITTSLVARLEKESHNVSAIGELLPTNGPRRSLACDLSTLPEGRGLIILIRDITEQLKKDRSRLEFASTVSHELRTPLATIDGYLELIEGSPTLDSEVKDQVGKAHEATHHMSELLQGFLRSTQIDNDSIQAIVRRPVDLEGVLKTTLDAFRPLATKQGVALELGTPNPNTSTTITAIPEVLGDPDRIREILENLLTNAFKFTEKGSVSVLVHPDEHFVTISVKDTGIGMKPEDQEQIFQRFFRVESTYTQTHGGTGLGLYITRSLVESLGGKIWVESVPDQGSSFHFTLPRAR
jgi:PAS domain S-box-containing protein